MEALIRLKALLSEHAEQLNQEEIRFVSSRTMSLPPGHLEDGRNTVLDNLGPMSPAVRANFGIARSIANNPFISVDDPTPRVEDLWEFEDVDLEGYRTEAMNLMTPRNQGPQLPPADSASGSLADTRRPLKDLKGGFVLPGGAARKEANRSSSQTSKGSLDVQSSRGRGRLDRARTFATIHETDVDGCNHDTQGEPNSNVSTPTTATTAAALAKRSGITPPRASSRGLPHSASASALLVSAPPKAVGTGRDTGEASSRTDPLPMQAMSPPPSVPRSTYQHGSGAKAGAGWDRVDNGDGDETILPSSQRQADSPRCTIGERREMLLSSGTSSVKRKSSLSSLKTGSTDEFVEEDFEIVDVRSTQLDLLKAMASHEWSEQKRGLDNLRRMCRKHPETVVGRLSETLSALLPIIDSLRSSLSRAALYTTADMAEYLGERLGKHLRIVLPMLLKKHAESNQFIRIAADAAWEAIITNSNPILCIEAALHNAKDRSSVIRSQVALAVSHTIHVHRERACRDPKALARLSKSLELFSKDKSAEVRTIARDGIEILLCVCPQPQRGKLLAPLR